jgi:hypothetical protein
MSTSNPNNLAPVPSFAERVTNTVERIQAQPARNEFGERAGSRYFEEAHWRSPAISSDLVAGAGAAENVFEVKVAGQANGRMEPGATNPRPSWQQDEAMKAAFIRGNDDTWRLDNPFMHQPRRSANLQSLAPMGDGFQGGERPNPEFGRKLAPPNGGRSRSNQADVSDR